MSNTENSSPSSISEKENDKDLRDAKGTKEGKEEKPDIVEESDGDDDRSKGDSDNGRSDGDASKAEGPKCSPVMSQKKRPREPESQIKAKNASPRTKKLIRLQTQLSYDYKDEPALWGKRL